LQFEDIGSHGTKVIVYNLWLNDEGIYELSFDDDDEVCRLDVSLLQFVASHSDTAPLPPKNKIHKKNLKSAEF